MVTAEHPRAKVPACDSTGSGRWCEVFKFTCSSPLGANQKPFCFNHSGSLEKEHFAGSADFDHLYRFMCLLWFDFESERKLA